MPTTRRRWLTVIGSCVLGASFGYTGAAKVASGPAATYLALATMGITDPWFMEGFAAALPWVEILLGCWLLTGIAHRTASLAALTLLSAFTSGVVILGISTGWKAACTCTGSLTGESVAVALARNAILLSLATSLVFGSWRSALRTTKIAAPGPA